jgi:tetratricopeptide (TPR) repeat protein
LYQKAYDHRDRLSDAERYITLGSYYANGPQPDQAKAISAYESLLDLDPDNVTALNNLAIEYRDRREFAKAEQLSRHAIEVQPSASVFFSGLFSAQISQAKFQEAEQTIQLAIQNLPRNPLVPNMRVTLYRVRGQHDSASMVVDSLMKARANDAATQRAGLNILGDIARLRGQIRESERLVQQARQSAAAAGNVQAPLNAALDVADNDAWFRGEKERALRAIERALVEHPLDSLPETVRPYPRLLYLYTIAGRPDLAKTMLKRFEAQQTVVGIDPIVLEAGRHGALANIALAEQRYDDAVREFRASDRGSCTVCVLPDIARAYDLAGNTDSAIAVFARYADGAERPAGQDARYLPGIHKRLGELYEAKGDRAKAASHYARFIEYWKNADPDLQPKVAEARARLQALSRAESVPPR